MLHENVHTIRFTSPWVLCTPHQRHTSIVHVGLKMETNHLHLLLMSHVQWNPNFSNLQGKRKLVREIGEFEKSRVKLQCLTEESERLLVRVIGRFEKLRVREIGIPLHYRSKEKRPYPILLRIFECGFQEKSIELVHSIQHSQTKRKRKATQT